jgi:hypothetical protein
MRRTLAVVACLLAAGSTFVRTWPSASAPIEAPASALPRAAQDLPEPVEVTEPTDLAAHALNGRALPPLEGDGSYSFLVGGHLYGSPKNTASIYPSASLLGSLDRLEESGAAFFMGLGDIVRYLTPKHLYGLRTGFVDALDMPLFNAVGNHDVAVRDVWLREYPHPTAGFLEYGPVLHLVLDTEADSGRIAGRQLEWFTTMLEHARTSESIRTVVIHSHKLVWADAREEFEIVARFVNARRGYVEDDGFVREVLPSVRALAAHKPVVWMSGDIGIEGRLPLFFHREADVDLSYVAVGIGDTGDDALLQVFVAPDGALAFGVVRLDGAPSVPLETFGLEYWKQNLPRR